MKVVISNVQQGTSSSGVAMFTDGLWHGCSDAELVSIEWHDCSTCITTHMTNSVVHCATSFQDVICSTAFNVMRVECLHWQMICSSNGCRDIRVMLEATERGCTICLNTLVFLKPM